MSFVSLKLSNPLNDTDDIIKHYKSVRKQTFFSTVNMQSPLIYECNLCAKPK